MKEVTLVVMAAGMGSRFGGLKQMEPVAKTGEVIIDFSVYDAMKAGFNKVVFIIKKELEADFKRIVGDRIAKKVKVEYVYQDVPEYRTKPFGTAEAVLCCKEVVKGPFAVINADDYYGKDGFVKLYDYLTTQTGYAMVGFLLENTLTESGTVSRGVCKIEDGYLADINEDTSIAKENKYSDDTVVSMNLWGLQPDIFDELEAGFDHFKQTKDVKKDEYFLPSVIDSMIKSKKVCVRVLESADKWYGITYKEDKDRVVGAISKMIEDGKYAGL